MEIVFAVNNFEDMRRIPVLPEKLDIENPWKNEEFETIGSGDLNLPGLAGLRSLTIESFFPTKEYAFAKEFRAPWEYVDFFKVWRAKRVPFRLIITGDDGREILNMPCLIEEFTYGIDRAGDIQYSMTIKEFVFVVR